MRSNKVPWSTLTKSASKLFNSSSLALSSDLGVSTCFLQYSMTLARILLVTLGRGMEVSAQSSSIMCLMVCDSTATASSTSKVSLSELLSTIIFPVDMVVIWFGGKEMSENPKPWTDSRWDRLVRVMGIGEGGWLFIEGVGKVNIENLLWIWIPLGLYEYGIRSLFRGVSYPFFWYEIFPSRNKGKRYLNLGFSIIIIRKEGFCPHNS